MSNERLKLVKTIYFNQVYGKGREFDDKLIKILKNEKTGEKTFELVSDPKMLYYINKPEYFQEIHSTYIDPDKVHCYRMDNRNLIKNIADGLDDLYSDVYEEETNEFVSFFFEALRGGNAKSTGKLHLNPNVHRSDINVEDMYISEHMEEYPMEESTYKPSKSYFDIEVDGIEVDGFPDENEALAPVNAITHWDRDSEISYTFLLREGVRDNPLIKEFEDNIVKFKEYMNKKYKDKYELDIEFKFKFYDDEGKMIKEYFDLVNITKPDFNMA